MAPAEGSQRWQFRKNGQPGGQDIDLMMAGGKTLKIADMACGRGDLSGGAAAEKNTLSWRSW